MAALSAWLHHEEAAWRALKLKEMRRRPPFDITVRATQEIRIAKGNSHPGIMEAIIDRIAGECVLLLMFIIYFAT